MNTRQLFLAGTLLLLPEQPHPQADLGAIAQLLGHFSSSTSLILENTHPAEYIVEPEIVAFIKEHFDQLLEEYTVKPGDTIAGIAKRYGIQNYDDLVKINSVYGKSFKTSKNGKHIIIRIEDKILVPRMERLSDFQGKLVTLHEVSKVIQRNSLYAKQDPNGKGKLLAAIQEDVYPHSPLSVPLARLLHGFAEVQRGAFDPDLPRVVDIGTQAGVTCASMIRRLMYHSINPQDMTDTEKAFFNTQNIHAWMLPEALFKLGFEQKENLMGNFDKNRVGTTNPIGNEEGYTHDLKKMYAYLVEQGVPGSLVPFYFRGSHYTGVVKAYNAGKKMTHYNTHQSILIGNESMEFVASEVPLIKSGKKTAFGGVLTPQNHDETSETGVASQNIVSFIVNFIQQRSDYSTNAVQDHRKVFVLKHLAMYGELIRMKINGTEIDIQSEIQKPDEEQIQVSSTDRVEFSGPMMIDGLHMMNSDSPDRAHNMNARTRFLWEFIISGMFLPTEIVEPQAGSFATRNYDNNLSGIPVAGIYDVRTGDTVENVLARLIPSFEKEAFSQLDPSAPDYETKRKALIQYYYGIQIKALQLAGFIQTEGRLNKKSIIINRPIPYFDSRVVPRLFREYIQEVKAELTVVDGADLYANFIIDKTLPGDTIDSLFHRLAKKIAVYGENPKYPHLSKIKGLNHYLQRTFLERFLSHSTNSASIDVDSFINKGKIPQYIDITLDLETIDAILEEVTSIEFNSAPRVKPIDSFVVDMVTSSAQNANLLKIIVHKESYPTPGGTGLRILSKKVGERVTPSSRYLNGKIDELDLQCEAEISGFPPIDSALQSMCEQRFKTISSLGDFQIRLVTLQSGYSNEFPKKEHLVQALSHLDSDWFQELRGHLSPSQNEGIDTDMSDIERVKAILTLEEPEKEDFRELYDLLFGLIRLDDGESTNIIGKVISASLMDAKINTHFTKLNGQLHAAGEDVLEIYSDEARMLTYEKAILLINNLSENIELYAFFQSTLIRILSESGIATFDELDFALEEDWKGSVQYNKNKALEYFRHLSALMSKKEAVGSEQMMIIEIVSNFLEDVDYKGTFSNSDLFAFLNNPDLRSALETLSISPSLLPQEEELDSLKLRRKLFKYAINL